MYSLNTLNKIARGGITNSANCPNGLAIKTYLKGTTTLAESEYDWFAASYDRDIEEGEISIVSNDFSIEGTYEIELKVRLNHIKY